MTPFFGGGEAYILNLVDFLNKKFKLVLLISSKDLLNRIQNEVQVYYEPSHSNFSYWKIFFVVFKLIKKYRVNVVILNGIKESLMTIFLKIFKVKTNKNDKKNL